MGKQTGSSYRRNQSRVKAIAGIIVVLLLFAGMLWAYIYASNSNPELDKNSLCPLDQKKIASLTVLLVDVTDPINIAQRQDFINQLDSLADAVPRNGKLIITKVDPISEHLLLPVLTVCNPGTAADASSWSGNPQKLGNLHAEKFRKPLVETFQRLLQASGAERSPILESIQSINLTEFQNGSTENLPKKLVVASDLLQNTSSISFYGLIPPAETLIASPGFVRTRTDLRGVEVELWMLERSDNRKSQPIALAELWRLIIEEQMGTWIRTYRISG